MQAALAEGPASWSPTRPGKPAVRQASLPSAQPAPGQPAAFAPGEWLLDRNTSGAPGDPPYVLRNAQGVVERYIEPTPSLDLESVVGQAVRIKHDTGQTLLATQLEIGLLNSNSTGYQPRAFAQRSPSSAVLPVQHQTDDPTKPIVLEELPVGNPAPPPVGAPSFEAPSPIAQPPLVAPGFDAPLATSHVCGPECDASCGNACFPHSYSCNPRPLADSVWGLCDPANLGLIPAPLRQRARCRGIEWGGWTQLGYHSDPTPLSVTKGDLGAFNDVPNNLRWQQQWFWIGKEANSCAGPDWGFRFDLLYGTDAQKTQAFGNSGGTWDVTWDHGIYGWAAPQFYGELAADDWSVIFGHFFTPVGYEVVMAPENFFYSHSLTMFNSEPFTHSGVLATYSPYAHPAAFELYLGYTLGWDTAFDQSTDGSTLVGGWSFRPMSSLTFAYVATIGNLGARSGGGDGYSHSIVTDVAVTPRLTYVLQSDYVSYDNQGGAAPGGDQVGLNQYLLYSINGCWGAGGRLEWWKSGGVSYYETTLGLNYRPFANFVMRPEIRHDWGSNFDQTTLGIDAVITY